MTSKHDFEKYANLSPFELKNHLIDLAQSRNDRMMLNAGRGNPNFLATLPRNAFFELGLFAAEESEISFSFLDQNIGGMPFKDDLMARFDDFIRRNRHKPGVEIGRAHV